MMEKVHKFIMSLFELKTHITENLDWKWYFNFLELNMIIFSLYTKIFTIEVFQESRVHLNLVLKIRWRWWCRSERKEKDKLYLTMLSQTSLSAIIWTLMHDALVATHLHQESYNFFIILSSNYISR